MPKLPDGSEKGLWTPPLRYAMGYPYQQSSDEVAAYDRLRIPDAEKRMLMEDNARAVFRLPS